MNITKNGLPISPEEEIEINKFLDEHKKLMSQQEQMKIYMDELGITDAENATEDQMIALSEKMFGKKS